MQRGLARGARGALPRPTRTPGPAHPTPIRPCAHPPARVPGLVPGSGRPGLLFTSPWQPFSLQSRAVTSQSQGARLRGGGACGLQGPGAESPQPRCPGRGLGRGVSSLRPSLFCIPPALFLSLPDSFIQCAPWGACGAKTDRPFCRVDLTF